MSTKVSGEHKTRRFSLLTAIETERYRFVYGRSQMRTLATMSSDRATADRARGGRSLDASRDGDILQAALELLVEQGYERVTIEAIATRARAGKATIYRRWNSKADLYIDAVNQLKPPAPAPPDTGSLVGDLRQLFTENLPDDRGFLMVGGVANALQQDPTLAESFRDRFIRPRRALLRTVLERAVKRGEIPAGRDIELVGDVFPALMLQRILFLGERPDREFVTRVLDQVLIPLATAPLSAREQPAEQPRATTSPERPRATTRPERPRAGKPKENHEHH